MRDGCSLVDQTRLTNEQLLSLLHNVRAHNARDRLNFIFDIGCCFSTDEQAKQEYLANLTREAYPDDPAQQVNILEAVTRKA